MRPTLTLVRAVRQSYSRSFLSFLKPSPTERAGGGIGLSPSFEYTHNAQILSLLVDNPSPSLINIHANPNENNPRLKQSKLSSQRHEINSLLQRQVNQQFKAFWCAEGVAVGLSPDNNNNPVAVGSEIDLDEGEEEGDFDNLRDPLVEDHFTESSEHKRNKVRRLVHDWVHFFRTKNSNSNSNSNKIPPLPPQLPKLPNLYTSHLLDKLGFFLSIEPSKINNNNNNSNNNSAGHGLFVKTRGLAKNIVEKGTCVGYFPGVFYLKEILSDVSNNAGFLSSVASKVGLGAPARASKGSILDYLSDDTEYCIQGRTDGAGILDCREFCIGGMTTPTKQFYANLPNLSKQHAYHRNPLACGQMVNHSTDPNVVAVAFDFQKSGEEDDGRLSRKLLRAFTPNSYFSKPTLLGRGLDDEGKSMCGVVLISTKDLQDGEELTVDYKIREEGGGRPDWY